MTSFTLNLISVKVSFHDIFKITLNITPVNITSCTVVAMVCGSVTALSDHNYNNLTTSFTKLMDNLGTHYI